MIAISLKFIYSFKKRKQIITGEKKNEKR